MKRSLNSPPLGANYGATVRLDGPNAPLALFRPASELERIRNPFLPPDGGPEQPVGAEAREAAGAEPREPVDAEFENSGAEPEGRESDVWSNDTPSRRVPRVAPSGKMIVGSFLVFAVLGAGGFAALYTAVHANDAANRATYEVDDSRGTTANANAVPVTAPGPGPTPLASSAAFEPASTAARIDSGAPMFGGAPTTTSRPSETHHAAVAPALAPARIERAPVRKTPIVVHVEPAPVFPPHRETDEKDGPVSEDALLTGSAHSAEAVQPQPPTEPNVAVHAEPVPTSTENPDDPRR
ncbi:MAG TPA: hypothetical protein VK841_19690 [Polyangiaceae bacterium]|jgi:hypothetical protein|nr:hypothetical protein [Polyangiaceae bacterium]